MVRFIVLLSAITATLSAQAHHPERECQKVTQRVDVIGPIGANLKPSHRRVYNRPTYIAGKMAYFFAPTSQEAMAWHKAEHRGAYKNNCGRIEARYFFPKPWESLRIGPRASLASSKKSSGLQPIDSGAEIPLFKGRYGSMESSADEMAFGDSESEGRRADITPELKSELPSTKNSKPSSDNIIDEDVPPAPKTNKKLKEAIEDAVGSGLEN